MIKMITFDQMKTPTIEEFWGNSDPFARVSPPPDGTHVVKLSLSTSLVPTGVEKGTTKKGNTYRKVHIMLEVQDEGDRKKMFDGANTLLEWNGSNRIVGILQALGESVESITTKTQLASKLVEALKGEPLCRVESEWVVRVEEPEGSKKYKTVKRGMTKFPKNPDGTYNPEITYNGRRLKAKAEIVRYLALNG